MHNPKRLELAFHPATADRWPDIEELFGERGACGGCWCMAWRLKRSQFVEQKGAGNRKTLKVIVENGGTPGILAYAGGRPIGWCAVAPREFYPALARSRVLKPIDDFPVWSVTCFFVEKEHRRRGVSVQLLRAAIDFVKQQGGKVLEGYPIEPYSESVPGPFAWVGLVAAFTKAGFKESARRSKSRPIMRFVAKKR
jgi:GNAT superfamily N-acetyltransferase